MTGSENSGGGLRGWFSRGPWLVAGVAAAVVLGPAAATASALEKANAAPVHRMVLQAAAANPAVTREDGYRLERTR
ncbi:hypothetical protein ABUW04_17025 [Streptacidiphilus sp. N1-10]|uniref:Uncharacterized protein n=1 Tax=Streptacidiphilus jeojiensis TaxID=3229225 RepID=A0ABV6XPF2_9ACTN